jgi:hypothetical protein
MEKRIEDFLNIDGNAIAFHKKSDAAKLEEIEKCSFEAEIPCSTGKTGKRKIIILSRNKFHFLVVNARKGIRVKERKTK